MATAAPTRIALSQNTWRPVKDESCKVLCPECYVQGTVLGQEDDATVWGCGKCGLRFSIDWGY